MATHPDGVTAQRLQEQLDTGYQTAWLLKQKLRLSSIPGANEPLQGLVEVSQREMSFRAYSRMFRLVLPYRFVIGGALEVTRCTTAQAELKPALLSCRIRLAAVSGRRPEFMAAFVRADVKPGTTLLTDDGPFLGLSDYQYAPRKEGPEPPRTEKILSDIENWLGTQDTLDEDLVNAGLKQFAAHLNWRVSFDAMLGVIASQDPKSYWDIIGRGNPRKGDPTGRCKPLLKSATECDRVG